MTRTNEPEGFDNRLRVRTISDATTPEFDSVAERPGNDNSRAVIVGGGRQK